MNHEEHDDLWRLLGKARTPEVSPFFSRNVLRELRANQQEQPGVIAWIFRRWQVSLVTALAVTFATIGTWQYSNRQPTVAELAQQVSASPDYAVITHLDELLASEESSVWLDNSRF